jgi:hypothetical protein
MRPKLNPIVSHFVDLPPNQRLKGSASDFGCDLAPIRWRQAVRVDEVQGEKDRRHIRVLLQDRKCLMGVVCIAIIKRKGNTALVLYRGTIQVLGQCHGTVAVIMEPGNLPLEVDRTYGQGVDSIETHSVVRQDHWPVLPYTVVINSSRLTKVLLSGLKTRPQRLPRCYALPDGGR